MKILTAEVILWDAESDFWKTQTIKTRGFYLLPDLRVMKTGRGELQKNYK